MHVFGVRFAAVVAFGLAGCVLAGCSPTARSAGKSDAAGGREVVVSFRAGTPRSVRLHARKACAHVVPTATPEPMPTSTLKSDQVYGVRFRVAKASDNDLSRLQNCLVKQHAVREVDLPDDDGGM